MAHTRDRGSRRTAAEANKINRVSQVRKHRDGVKAHRLTMLEIAELDAELDAELADVLEDLFQNK